MCSTSKTRRRIVSKKTSQHTLRSILSDSVRLFFYQKQAIIDKNKRREIVSLCLLTFERNDSSGDESGSISDIIQDHKLACCDSKRIFVDVGFFNNRYDVDNKIDINNRIVGSQ